MAALLAPIPVLDAVPEKTAPAPLRRYAAKVAGALWLTWIGATAMSVVWAIFLATRP